MGERGKRSQLYTIDDYANIDFEENEVTPEETSLKDIWNTEFQATIKCHLRLIDLIRLFGFINGLRLWLRTPSKIFKEMMK